MRKHSKRPVFSAAVAVLALFALLVGCSPAPALDSNSVSTPESSAPTVDFVDYIGTERLTESFTESVGVNFTQDFTMVYVEGGTFTLGWETSGVGPPDSAPVDNVAVSDYFIAETEVTQNLWNAVMGESLLPGAVGEAPKTGVAFYQVQDFLGRLYVLTGKTYRLPTEAEWEFAAKGGNPGFEAGHHKLLYSGSDVEEEVAYTTAGAFGVPGAVKSRKPNILGIYDMSGNVEEWVYNTWSGTHSGGLDPYGPKGHVHNQKTRRGGSHAGLSVTRYATARQIRSIDGSDGGLGFRIALSGDMNSVPPGVLRPRDIRRPDMDDRLVENSYRDPRWVTGDDYAWTGDLMGYMPSSIKVWDTGEILVESRLNGQLITYAGQWYSVNNVGLVIVTETERITVPYVFMTDDLMTVINDKSFFGAGAPYGRFEKTQETGTPATKPVIANPRSPEELAAESPHDHKLYDMDNIPPEARGQDPRLLDGPDRGWHQGLGGGGGHQYRQDIDPDSFRFTVYLHGAGGFNIVLVRGSWYTVNDMLLVVEQSNGGVAYYVYTVNENTGEMLHISFQSYERGDPRVFNLTPNADVVGHTYEIPAAGAAGFGATTTFRKEPPAGPPCPGLPEVGSCGKTVYDCACATICPICNVHISRSVHENTAERLAQYRQLAQDATDAVTATNATTAEQIMTAVLRVGLHETIKTSWGVPFGKTNASAEEPGLITGAIRLTMLDYTDDVTINLPIERSAARTITPDAGIGGSPLTITATGLRDGWSQFDLGSLFGTAGGGPFTYALWFEAGGTVSFDQALTLSYQGVRSRAVAAGETVAVDESWSEYAVTLDDGNSVILIYEPSPGNFAALPPTLAMDDFPGTVTGGG
jgi:hypothetical protein